MSLVSLFLLACAPLRDPDPLVFHEAAPYVAETADVGPLVARLQDRIAALDRETPDPSHEAEVAAMVALADVVEALYGDTTRGQDAAAEVRLHAERLAASSRTNARHADLVEGALLGAVGAVEPTVVDRWDLAEPLQEARGAVTGLREDRPLLPQRRAMLQAFRLVGDLMARAARWPGELPEAPGEQLPEAPGEQLPASGA